MAGGNCIVLGKRVIDLFLCSPSGIPQGVIQHRRTFQLHYFTIVLTTIDYNNYQADYSLKVA